MPRRSISEAYPTPEEIAHSRLVLSIFEQMGCICKNRVLRLFLRNKISKLGSKLKNKKKLFNRVRNSLFLKKIQMKFRHSLWLLPGFIGLCSIALAVLLLLMEFHYENLLVTSWIRDLSKRTITTTLSTLLAAIVTVFGFLLPLIFTILLRASNQFSPKILNIYRSALFPKLFIGLILGSTLYLMTVIAVLNLFFWVIPSISFLVAFLLIILTVYSLPPFFDRLTTSLEPSYIVQVIVQDMKKTLENLDAFQNTDSEELRSFQERSFLDTKQYTYAIASKETGYLETIELKEIIEICEKENSIAAIPVRIGDFILSGSPLLYLKDTPQPNNECIRKLQDQFSFGERRLAITDVELQLEELLSIIVRALSPGITDLATATECINYVGSVCNLLLNKRLSSGIHKDKKGEIRLVTKEFDFFGFAHAAFDVIRQNVHDQPTVIIKALQVIEKLVNNCQSQERAKILKEIAFQFMEEIKGKHLPFDQKKILFIVHRIETIVNGMQEDIEV